LVVATHWHDDHVRGISSIVERCKSARVAISNALKSKEFLTLLGLYSNWFAEASSGVSELSQIFALYKSKQRDIRLASVDSLLHREQIMIGPQNLDITIYALSPSDDTVLNSIFAFGQQMQGRGTQKRIAPLQPNHTSVVLWIDVGGHRVLLGADLEESTTRGTGWSIILNESQIISDGVGIFKVPHHGSENAHHHEIWNRTLVEQPFAIISPYARGKKPLPTLEDQARIASYTSNAFLTASPQAKKSQFSERVVNDAVKEVTKSMYSLRGRQGQIRLRKSLNAPLSAPWTCELFGSAFSLTKYLESSGEARAGT
jgi:hypothetical protein